MRPLCRDEGQSNRLADVSDGSPRHIRQAICARLPGEATRGARFRHSIPNELKIALPTICKTSAVTKRKSVHINTPTLHLFIPYEGPGWDDEGLYVFRAGAVVLNLVFSGLFFSSGVGVV